MSNLHYSCHSIYQIIFWHVMHVKTNKSNGLKFKFLKQQNLKFWGHFFILENLGQERQIFFFKRSPQSELKIPLNPHLSLSFLNLI